MIIKKTPMLLAILASAMCISVSTGFDLYAHASSYYFPEAINPFDSFWGHITPRYLLLSVLYEVTAKICIPIGYLVLTLVGYPSYHIFKTFSIYKSKYTLSQILITLFVFLLCIFYSGLSITLLFLVCFIISKKRRFLVGGLFHPGAPPIFFVALFFLNRPALIYFAIVVFAYVMLAYIKLPFLDLFSIQNPYSSLVNIRFQLDNDTFFFFFNQLISKKSNEVFVLLTIILTGLLFKKIHLRFYKFTLEKKAVLMLSLSLYLSIFFFFLQKQSLQRTILTLEMTNPIYITWFDWGKKDYKGSHADLYKERYIYNGVYIDK